MTAPSQVTLTSNSGPLGTPNLQWGPPGAGSANPGLPTAASAHNALIAIALELAFVVIATMLAGISDTWGSAMVALMLAMLVLRGLFQVNLFGNFVNAHPLIPQATLV